jgi:hypothetical protein
MGVDDGSKADWDKETKRLEVVFDDTKTSVDKIDTAVAKVGHDTPHHKASTEVYYKLPNCCNCDQRADLKAGKEGHLQ